MISIVCPSRGRPELAYRMAESCISNAKKDEKIEILFYLNTDDEKLEDYERLKTFKQVKIDIGPHQSTCYSWNLLSKKANNDLIMLAGDDVIFETKDWDTLIVKEYSKYDDKILMVVPNDGRNNKLARTRGIDQERYLKSKDPVLVETEPFGAPHFILHKNWIKTLGYFAPPFFWHWYVDTWTQSVASRLNRCLYMPNVICKAKKIFDSTAKEVRGKNNVLARDVWLWSIMRDRYIDIDTSRLKKFIDSFQK